MLTGDKDKDFNEMIRLFFHEARISEAARLAGNLIEAARTRIAAMRYLSLAIEAGGR